MPTMGNCMLLDDGDAAAISNWQEVAKGAQAPSRRGPVTFPMSRRYAEGAERQAATLKSNMMEAFNNLAQSAIQQKPQMLDTEGFMIADAWSWDDFRDQFAVRQAGPTVAPPTPGMAPATPRWGASPHSTYQYSPTCLEQLRSRDTCSSRFASRLLISRRTTAGAASAAGD